LRGSSRMSCCKRAVAPRPDRREGRRANAVERGIVGTDSGAKGSPEGPMRTISNSCHSARACRARPSGHCRTSPPRNGPNGTSRSGDERARRAAAASAGGAPRGRPIGPRYGRGQGTHERATARTATRSPAAGGVDDDRRRQREAVSVRHSSFSHRDHTSGLFNTSEGPCASYGRGESAGSPVQRGLAPAWCVRPDLRNWNMLHAVGLVDA